MWESPVDIIYGDIHEQIVEERERTIVKAIQSCGVNVDKEQLVKALMYDRQQYEKGYADAKHDAIEAIERNAYRHTYIEQIISIIENLPSAKQTAYDEGYECGYYKGYDKGYEIGRTISRTEIL